MDWNDLRVALAIAKTGNVVGAGKLLGVAHTTVLRRIAAFEASSNAVLFTRTRQKWTPTVAGTAILKIAGDLDVRISAFRHRIAAEDEHLAGEVVVTTVELLAAFFASKLGAFRAQHPAVRVRLRVGVDVLDLARQEADIAVRVRPVHRAGLTGTKVGTAHFAVYGTPSLAKVKQVDWVCFDDDLKDNPQTVWEGKHVPAERVALRTNSRVVFVDAVRAGLGVGVLPCALGDQQPGLVRRSDPLAELRVPVWVLTHQRSRAIARVQALRQFLIQCMREAAPK